MNLTDFLWNIGGVVLGIIAAFGTLYLMKVSDDLIVWVKKKMNSKAIKK